MSSAMPAFAGSRAIAEHHVRTCTRHRNACRLDSCSAQRHIARRFVLAFPAQRRFAQYLSALVTS